MKVNVFEGARRISVVIALAWAIGCIAYAALAEPYARLTYAIGWPGEKPTLAEHCAADDAREYLEIAVPDDKPISVTLCFSAQRAENGQRLIPYKAMPSEAGAANLPAVKQSDGWEDAEVQLPRGTTVRELYRALKDADARGDAKRAREIAATIKALPPEVRPLRFWMNGPLESAVREYTKAAAENFSLDAGGVVEAKRCLHEARFVQWKQALFALACGVVIGWLLIACVGWIVRGFLGIPRGMDSRPIPAA